MNKKIYIIVLAILILLVSCKSSDGNNENISSTPTALITPSAAPTAEPTDTPTPSPTETPTPTPTETPTPTPTPVPVINDIITDSGREGLYDIPMDKFNFTAYNDNDIMVTAVGDYLVAIYPDYYAEDYVGVYTEEDEKTDNSNLGPDENGVYGQTKKLSMGSSSMSDRLACSGSDAADSVNAAIITDYDIHTATTPDYDNDYDDDYGDDYYGDDYYDDYGDGYGYYGYEEDSTTFVCEIKNLITGETRTETFTFSIPSGPYITLTSLNDETFVVVNLTGTEYMVYNTEFELQSDYTLPDLNYRNYYETFFGPAGEFYYIESGTDTLYKKVSDSAEPEIIMQIESFKDVYAFTRMTDNVITAYYNDYISNNSTRYFFNIETGQTDYIEYSFDEYLVSDDGSELLINHCDENVFELYDISKCPIPVLNEKFKTGKKYKPKATYSLGEETDSWKNLSLDWNRRLIIDAESDTQGPTTNITYNCYSLDTGDLFSTINYRVDDIYFFSNPIILPENGLFLIRSSEDTPIFKAWDYTNGKDCTDTSLYVRTNYIPPELDAKRKTLEDKYNIFIYLGPEIGDVVSDYIVTVSYDYDSMSYALDTIDETLAVYPDGFLNQIKVDSIKTLGIYLCEGFRKDGPNSIDTAIAVATSYGYERLLILDINYSGESLAQNLIHEISHWIDKRINYKLGEDKYDEIWCELNPKDFHYCYSYVDGSYNWKYIYSSSNQNSYFTDSYSQTYPTEDRARLFEYLMYPSEYEDYFENEHIREKTARFFELIRENFDTTGWPEVTVWERKLNDYNDIYSADTREDSKLPEVSDAA